MIGVIVISESNAAKENLSSLKKVLGQKKLPGVEAMSVKSNFNPKTLQNQIKKKIQLHPECKKFVILSELFGSTQTNVCLDFISEGETELITGYNFPMLLKAVTTNQNETSLDRFVKAVMTAGKKYIKHVN